MSRIPMLTLATCIALAAPTLAADNKPVKIVHVATGKMLAIAGDLGEASARVVLTADDKAATRLWSQVPFGELFALVNQKGGRALDVYENSTSEGAPIIVWDDKKGSDNQLWSWEGKDQTWRIKSKLSGLVLDVDSEGGIVQRKSDANAKSQLWRLVEQK